VFDAVRGAPCVTAQYISAAEAYDRLDPLVVGSPAYTICPRACDGILTARAAILFWGNERRENCPIPKEFWWAGAEAALTQNWRSGDFETWIDNRLHCRAYGVMFLEAEIDVIVPGRQKPPAAPQLNFAPAAECVDQLSRQAGIDPATAVKRLVHHCATGLIASRCSRFWWRISDRYDSQREDELVGEIPDWFWEQCADHPDTIFDWRSGKVSARAYIDDEHYKVIVKGLEFDVSGVVALEGMLQSQKTAAALEENGAGNTVRAGRKRDSEKWDAWIAELAAHIHDTGVPEGRGAEGQDELIAAIENRLSERGLPTLARTTVQSAARAILLRLRSAGNSETG
jgi:rhodanese-related sulfurtransferase